MSGIFGFTRTDASPQLMEESIGALRYWNQIYGHTASADRLMDGSGIGCHVEHLSDRFPHGAPVLDHHGAPAVVDALLYNRDEILSELQMELGSGISDEELLLALIDRKGYQALEMVNGDFAGAIYDQKASEWTLFRDHMGVRPLFFYNDRDLFVFSTDIRGIVAVPGVDSRFNSMLLYKYITRLDILSTRNTEFEHIRCLQPGSYCRFRMTDAGFRMDEKIYWYPRRRKLRLGSDEVYRQELRRLITDAVHRRCDAVSGLLGGELSGGLDSSIIDILVNRYGREAVYYSWSPDPERFPLREGEDERKVVLDICQQENISCKFLHREERVTNSFITEHVMPPYVTTLQITYGSRWMRSKGARAVFTGHGGDEGVSHRGSRFEILYNGELLAYFRLFWKDLQGKRFRLLRTVRAGILDAYERWKKLRTKIPEEMLRPSVFRREFCEAMIRELDDSRFYFSVAPHRYVQNGGSRPRLDNCAYQGAFCGVRYLIPYVDYRVMDFALSIPRRLYVGQMSNRLIFRDTFADIMPESLRNVFYKDLASTRGENHADEVNTSFHHRVEQLLAGLDQERWGDVLDFEGIRALHDIQITDVSEIANWTFLMNKLEIFVRIQNVQENAGRWREFDAENKIL